MGARPIQEEHSNGSSIIRGTTVIHGQRSRRGILDRFWRGKTGGRCNKAGNSEQPHNSQTPKHAHNTQGKKNRKPLDVNDLFMETGAVSTGRLVRKFIFHGPMGSRTPLRQLCHERINHHSFVSSVGTAQALAISLPSTVCESRRSTAPSGLSPSLLMRSRSGLQQNRKVLHLHRSSDDRMYATAEIAILGHL